MQFLSKRALAALFLFFTACSAPTCAPEWVLQTKIVRQSCFNSSRLYFPTKDTFCGLEMEIGSVESGIRAYLNVFSFPINPENPIQNTVTVSIGASEETQTFTAFIF